MKKAYCYRRGKGRFYACYSNEIHFSFTNSRIGFAGALYVRLLILVKGPFKLRSGPATKALTLSSLMATFFGGISVSASK